MNKNVLITGASGGIGKEIASIFASRGFNLILIYNHNRESIDDLISSFSRDTRAFPIKCDLTSSCQISSAVDLIHSKFGTISYLINNAGIAYPQKLFTETTDQEAEYIFSVNVLSMLRLTRLFLDDLRYNQGSIVNVSSMWGITGASCEVLYSASKAAVIGFTKSLAKEMGPSGVRVNCVAPGFIDTDMNNCLSAADKESFRLSTPLEKIGTPGDIADAVFYLSQSEFITGQILSVDGGIVI